MLLHRYHNIDFVLQLDVETAIELIKTARSKDREERIFQQWVAQLPIMAFAGTSVSFQDYKDRVTGANIDRRPTAAILAELDEIEAKFQGGM